jgi:hypothetical protein
MNLLRHRSIFLTLCLILILGLGSPGLHVVESLLVRGPVTENMGAVACCDCHPVPALPEADLPETVDEQVEIVAKPCAICKHFSKSLVVSAGTFTTILAPVEAHSPQAFWVFYAQQWTPYAPRGPPSI